MLSTPKKIIISHSLIVNFLPYTMTRQSSELSSTESTNWSLSQTFLHMSCYELWYAKTSNGQELNTRFGNILQYNKTEDMTTGNYDTIQNTQGDKVMRMTKRLQ